MSARYSTTQLRGHRFERNYSHYLFGIEELSGELFRTANGEEPGCAR
jgi:hypothetical protein